MDSRDSLYEPVEALHVVISCDYQSNLYINVLLIVILVTYKDIQKVSVLFPRYFIYILDVTNVLFLNIVPLLLNTVCPLVCRLLKGIRIKVFW